MNNNRKLDIIAGLLFIAIAALIIWVAIPYGVQEPKKIKFVALSPSYYPRLVGYCLLIFGAALVGTRLTRSQDESTDSSNLVRKDWLMKLACIIGTLAGYYLCLETLGFVLASTIALFILLLLAGERKPIPLLLISTLLPVSLHLFFTKVANIPIPSGPLQSFIGGA